MHGKYLTGQVSVTGWQAFLMASLMAPLLR